MSHLEKGTFICKGYEKTLPEKKEEGKPARRVCKAKFNVRGALVSVSMYDDVASELKEGDEASILRQVYAKKVVDENGNEHVDKMWVFKYLPLGETSTREQVNSIFGDPE